MPGYHWTFASLSCLNLSGKLFSGMFFLGKSLHEKNIQGKVLTLLGDFLIKILLLNHITFYDSTTLECVHTGLKRDRPPWPRHLRTDIVGGLQQLQQASFTVVLWSVTVYFQSLYTNISRKSWLFSWRKFESVGKEFWLGICTILKKYICDAILFEKIIFLMDDINLHINQRKMIPVTYKLNVCFT